MNTTRARKLSFRGILVLTLIFLIVYGCGYRLNSLSAAKANSLIGKDITLIDEAKFNWGNILILKTQEKAITAVCYKEYGILWRSNFSTHCYNHNDSIQTIGGINFVDDKGRQATVYTIIVNDPNVKYIEIGSDENLQRKEVVLNKPITFSWPFQMNVSSIPMAYGNNSELLYEYRYKEPNYTNPEDLRWYSVKAK